MEKRLRLLALGIVAAILFASCGSELSPTAPTLRASPSPVPTPTPVPSPTPSPAPTPKPTPRPTPTPAPTPTPGPGPGGGITISISGMFGSHSFSPSDAKLRVGQTVTWKNDDTVVHNVAQDGGGFSTPDIPPGAKSRPVKVTTAGTLGYYCVLHPAMTGNLIVSP